MDNFTYFAGCTVILFAVAAIVSLWRCEVDTRNSRRVRRLMRRDARRARRLA